jgi:PAS domain S-box-containing protein
MQQVTEFFRKLFDTSDWPPRWVCGRWTDFHGWFYIISDLMIWSAYFAIPLIILRFVSRKRDAQFHRIYILFAAFILACGSTHFLDAVMFWYPAYRFNALIRFATGVISWMTVFHLIRVLPKAFALKSPGELETEIQHRKKAEEKLRVINSQLSDAQQIARIGHWEWDVKANTLYWSPSLLRIYGLTEQEVEGLSYERFLDKVHPEDRSYVQSIIEKSFEEKKFREYYHRIVLKDGTIKTLHARGEIIVDSKGDVIKMIGTGQDITEQKNAQQELLRKTHELETMNDELQKFAYIASHDLQEPLRKIITFTSLLEKDLRPEVDNKGQVYIDKVVNASSRMQKLIDDILQFARLSGNSEPFETCDLNKLLEQVLSDMEVQITQTGAQIEVGKLPVIDCNPSQLGQVFQNLISNAIKFRNSDVQPKISITAVVGPAMNHSRLDSQRQFSIIGDPVYWEAEKYCRISVKDNGIGFDEAYLDKIFNLFQRLHSKNTYEGTGIGLSICKKIVDYHHGTITAKSKPGEGAEFIIELPVTQTEVAGKNGSGAKQVKSEK